MEKKKIMPIRFVLRSPHPLSEKVSEVLQMYWEGKWQDVPVDHENNYPLPSGMTNRGRLGGKS